MEISEVNPDGNVYQLKDTTARTKLAQIETQNVYSTEETDTGKKWIDGRTIYRKCGYHAGAVSSSLVTFDALLTDSYVDIMISQSGCATSSSGYITPIGGAGVKTNRAVLQIKPQGLQALDTDVSYSKWYWIVEYVKK